MTWLELSLRCHRRDWTRVEAALEELGALSVTLLDAEDVPILEPAAGETPLWPELVVNALFDADTDERGVIAALRELAGPADFADPTTRVVEDADWTRVWMDQYQPMQFGKRLWIYPSTMEPDVGANDVVVRLDPGLAFGSGTHPTTALCLEFLDELDLAGKRVLDFGCGSGVLAIAALKLGAAHATGVDNDPQAIIATRDNGERNDVLDRLEAFEPGDPRVADGSFDVVVANILAGALIQLSDVLRAAAKPGAPIALSGILAEQAEEVARHYSAFCEEVVVTQKDDWVRITGIVRAA